MSTHQAVLPRRPAASPEWSPHWCVTPGCVEWYDPETGESLGGLGPAGCYCEMSWYWRLLDRAKRLLRIGGAS